MEKEMTRVKRIRMYQGAIVDVYRDYMQFSNGNTEEWDYIHHRGAAAVVPVTDDGRIIMVRQYRNAVYGRCHDGLRILRRKAFQA